MILSNLHRIASYIEEYEAKFLVGVEITHVPPPLIGKAVELAWKEGAEIVVVHGETLAEPVAEGTNSAALNEEVNILAHPGLISVEEAEKAAENGIFLEISSRSGHCLANGHISRIAGATGCQLVINTDTHSPSDIISKQEAMRILIGSGIDRKDCERVLSNGKKLFNRLRK
jgi:histidinol phosphatase-like PHP family hydrolase